MPLKDEVGKIYLYLFLIVGAVLLIGFIYLNINYFIPSDDDGINEALDLAPVLIQEMEFDSSDAVIDEEADKVVEPTTMKVKAFFPNDIENPEMMDCSLVYPVERIVPYTKGVARASLNELLRGISKEEEDAGFYTNIPTGTTWQNISIEGGVASVDFNEQLDYQVGGSCLTASIRSQIEKTLEQFATVDEVIISIKGESESILQP